MWRMMTDCEEHTTALSTRCHSASSPTDMIAQLEVNLLDVLRGAERNGLLSTPSRAYLDHLVAPDIVHLDPRGRQREEVGTQIDPVDCIRRPGEMLPFLHLDHQASKRLERGIPQNRRRAPSAHSPEQSRLAPCSRYPIPSPRRLRGLHGPG